MLRATWRVKGVNFIDSVMVGGSRTTFSIIHWMQHTIVIVIN